MTEPDLSLHPASPTMCFHIQQVKAGYIKMSCHVLGASRHTWTLMCSGLLIRMCSNRLEVSCMFHVFYLHCEAALPPSY